MTRKLQIAAAALLIVLSTWVLAGAGPVLAEAGEPVRCADGSVDISATIDVLRREDVNTDLYQCWRTAGDWDQLPAFADAAKEAGIEVWVYLVPWSETPLKRKTFAYSEPFKTDYIAWGDAIGKLSKAHPNITAWVMDDFYINATQPDRFTNKYVDRMLAAGKAQNPKLKFFPVVYFQQPWADFVQRFATKVDGVIACYPQSMAEIDEALGYLNDQPRGPSLLASWSRNAKVRAGSEAIATCRVRAPAGAHLRLFLDDQTFGEEIGAHVAFVRMNGRAAWVRYVGDDRVETDVNLPLPDSRNGVLIEVGVRVAELSNGALVQIRLDDIRVVNREGRRIDTKWRATGEADMHPELTPASDGGGEFHVPMHILVATLPAEHEKRYGEAPTVDSIRQKVRLATDCVRQGKTAGIICWYTPKSPAGEIVKMAGEELSDLGRAAPRRTK